jgi:hypothetical protein
VFDNVLAALSISGVVLYVSLRFPYAVYYETLHTAPEDVGLGYAQLLAQSALGVFFLAAIAAVISTCFIFVVGYLALVPRMLGARRGLRLAPKEHSPFGADPYTLTDDQLANLSDIQLAELTPEQVDRLVLPALSRVAERHMPRVGATMFAVLGPELRRAMLARSSWQKGGRIGPKPTIRRPFRNGVRLITRLIYETVRPWVVVIFVGWVVLVLYVGLPVFALWQADNVKSACRSHGSDFGLFDFRAQPAVFGERNVGPVSLRDDRLMYLGQGGATYVLFDCDSKETVSVPISGHSLLLQDR